MAHRTGLKCFSPIALFEQFRPLQRTGICTSRTHGKKQNQNSENATFESILEHYFFFATTSDKTTVILEIGELLELLLHSILMAI